MTEEEQFVNIDLNDDDVCSVCKLGTDIDTLSFCHICFQLNIEGLPRSSLLHSKSLRGHKDCFEKYHLIAKQQCPRSKLSKSTYEEVKTLLSKKINWIVQYAQNKDLYSDSECSKIPQHQTGCTLLPQFDSQVPRYSSKWIDRSSRSVADCSQGILEQRDATRFKLGMLQQAGATFCPSGVLWSSPGEAQKMDSLTHDAKTSVQKSFRYSTEELRRMTRVELEQLNEVLLRQIQEVFEELACVVQEKDSLSSELQVRNVAIEQLLKNCSKLPCLQVGRAGTKASITLHH
ncbi:protein EURL homolog [Microcaecilia unicolor]|uniref:Protein EURL homolog n=1 Tax=Microcaecilia unicolor TaxID=1415580 RepID=A0A6P7YAI0_9AMPH|nr:protein EURL homolog [Microcaecilia unicolor]XP_030060071.1 protein EURL homolog [Microcaecilia unicolor]